MFAVRTRKDVSKTQNRRQKFACKTQNRRQKWQPDHKYQATHVESLHDSIVPTYNPTGGPFCKTSGNCNNKPANYFRHATTCSILHQIATANITVSSAPTSTIYPRPTRRSYLPCFLAALFILQIISSRRRRGCNNSSCLLGHLPIFRPSYYWSKVSHIYYRRSSVCRRRNGDDDAGRSMLPL